MIDLRVAFLWTLKHQMTSRWGKAFPGHAQQGCTDKPGLVSGALSHCEFMAI